MGMAEEGAEAIVYAVQGRGARKGVVYEWKACVPVSEERKDTPLKGTGMEAVTYHVVQLLRRELQGAEEVSEAQGAGTLVLVREPESVGRAPLSDP